jgi:hypothetical protein
MRAIALRLINAQLVELIATGLAHFDRRHALHLRGWAGSVRHRNEDHTDFWAAAEREFPRDSQFTRKKVHSALCSGRIAMAEAGLDALIAMRTSSAADCKFVIGLANFDRRAGDVARIRARTKRFLASLRGGTDYRIAGLRLSRLIFAHFPRRAHAAGPDEARKIRVRFSSMLRRSGVRSEPGQLLERSISCEATLELAAARCLFDTDISREQCRAFISLVHDRLAARQPFSFVRIGDGDAACLPYEPRLSGLTHVDALDRERIWWGAPLKARLRARLVPLVARAMWDADCIGIPATGRFLRELNLRKPDSLELSLTGRGLRSILYCAERFETFRSPGRPPPVFASCHLHQDLALWNCYAELFDGVGDILLVSCHPELADWMSTQFGARIAGNIVLPPDRVSGPLLRNRVAERRLLPDMLDEIGDMIANMADRRLVLVGAGYPGKWLVEIARQKGGVALDVGSIFDYWLGLPTRSYLDMSPA